MSQALEALGETRQRITLPALFTTFLIVSLLGFGGPIVWVRRILVERRRWLDDREFTDLLSFCQFMPGPNVVSIAVCVGRKFRGPPGALAALAGFILLPWMLGFGLGAIYLHFAQVAAFQNVLHGLSAAAAGLVIATGLRLLLPHWRRPAALLFAVLAFVALAVAKLPLLVVILGLVPPSIGAAWMQRVVAR